MQLAEAGAAGREVPGTVLTLRALADSFGTRSRRFETAVTRRVVPGILQQGPHNSLWDHQTAALKAVKAGDAMARSGRSSLPSAKAAHYLAGLADSTGRLRRPAG